MSKSKGIGLGIIFILLFAVTAWADIIKIDDFKAVDGWRLNPDGGVIEISKSDLDRPSMRLDFAGKGHNWGNAEHPISIPKDAVSIDFDLYVEKSGQDAVLFVWLFEKDGDGWVGYVNPDGKPLYTAGNSWRHVSIPIASFSYSPRGNRIEEILTVNKITIGLGIGPATVSVADLTIKTAKVGSEVKMKRTSNFVPENGAKGRIAILKDDFPSHPGNSDPDVLAAELRKGGYGVTILKSGDMSDPSVLTKSNFDCLVLPNGPSYPYEANGPIKAYLKSGGCFLSMGGYVFDQPCVPDESGKMIPGKIELTAEEIAVGKKADKSLNTRFGTPGDTMGIEPDQIGVFDPGYKIHNANQIKCVYGGSFTGKGLSGYSTCAILGSNNPVFPIKWGKWVPIIEAYDEFGRPMGSLGAYAFNYAGPYAGSSWAFFGVTDRDLFAKNGLMLPNLNRVMDTLLARTVVHSLKTDLACYKPGETVKVTCKAANLGSRTVKCKVELIAFWRDGSEEYRSQQVPADLKAGETRDVVSEFKVSTPVSDLVRLEARLIIDGDIKDTAETGFVVADQSVIAKGFNLKYKDNFFHDGDRPVLLSGTNVTGEIFTDSENPLIWDRDIRMMHEYGLNTLRMIHYSPFVAEHAGGDTIPQPLSLPQDKLPIWLERKTDALVQLCQKYKIILFLGIHDWQPVLLSDEELIHQKNWARLIADRYKNVPGIMIDIENEPNVNIPADDSQKVPDDITRFWNGYLKDKYETDEALKDAWRKSPPEARIGSIPWTKGKDEWDDIRTYDADYFRNILTKRWYMANRDGVKEGDPDMPVSVGYLQEYWALNKIMNVEGLDFANMHSYNSIDVLRADMKMFDRRFDGKSISLGEFGSVEDHSRRNNGVDTDEQDTNRYLLTGHYCFGEGGSWIKSWCWKDMDDVVFSWGIVYPNGGPAKDLLKAYRNQSLLFRQVRPVYQPDEFFLVVPTEQLLGGQSGGAVQIIYSVVNSMLDLNGNFGAIDDLHLDKLPKTARILVYPTPAHIPDSAYPILKSFVEKGGTLCITGDVGFDELRRRTRADRLEELCGVKSENQQTWTPTTGTGGTDGFVKTIGKGEVRFIPNQKGLKSDGKFFLEELIKTRNPGLHEFTIHELNGHTQITVNPKTNACGMFRYGSEGQLLALESAAPVGLGDKTTIKIHGHFALISGDGKDITESSELIVLPFGVGEIDLGFVKGDVIVQTGEIENGAWKPLSESKEKRIKTTRHDAFDIRIVAPRSHLKSLGDHVAKEMLLKK